MHRGRLSLVVAVVALVGLPSCRKSLPHELPQAPGLKLGLPQSDVLKGFKLLELKRTQKTIMRYELEQASRPASASAVRVLFGDDASRPKESLLVYVEARLASPGGWSSAVTQLTAELGAPRSLHELLGVDRLELVAEPTESAGWADDDTVLVYVRDPGGASAGLARRASLAELQSELRRLPAAEEPQATGEVGVAECDAYIALFDKCLARMPEESRAAMRAAFRETKDAWRSAAGTPEGRASLATACKAARDATASVCP